MIAMASRRDRIEELRRRYNAQSKEYWELGESMRRDNPAVRAVQVSEEQRLRAALRGEPLMTNEELLELYDALPNDRRERAFALPPEPLEPIAEPAPPPPPRSVLARLVDWAGQRLFGGSWR